MTLSASQSKRQNKGERGMLWNGSRWIHPADRQAIYIRDGRKCLYCGARENAKCKLSLDHLVPHALGGADIPENLLTVCCRCNFRKQDKSLTEFLAVLKGEGRRTHLIAARVQTAIATPIDRTAGQAAVRENNRAKRARKAAQV